MGENRDIRKMTEALFDMNLPNQKQNNVCEYDYCLINGKTGEILWIKDGVTLQHTLVSADNYFGVED